MNVESRDRLAQMFFGAWKPAEGARGRDVTIAGNIDWLSIHRADPLPSTERFFIDSEPRWSDGLDGRRVLSSESFDGQQFVASRLTERAGIPWLVMETARTTTLGLRDNRLVITEGCTQCLRVFGWSLPIARPTSASTTYEKIAKLDSL